MTRTAATDFERRRLWFAASSLTGLALVFVLAMFMRYCASQPEQIQAAQEIFEVAKTAIPPIVTLVLGYYFGNSRLDEPRPPSSRTVQTGTP